MTDHAEMIHPDVAPSGPGCVECDATGSWWVHLRRCAACGHVGCCDDSLNTHATRHWEGTGHAVIQSYEPGETWSYDYRDRSTFEGVELAAPTSHPVEQAVPGPADRLPGDWLELLGGSR
ncbi:UBP-type zinc finger domain-containing protein [Curtobacterium sp. A7_M15]|jgi:hypothetical protein|uniref:UBP-type zinc finger domain-containing protein n=1 Tax=Curtobacterium sp. A7_M15 TaxID=3065241 RepID=UPI002737C9FD|nr:UBP-type zinc finger domain-containing protein [Curtobacterium sp. A7_M15]MDP4333340.1 UBP-type zinc finger domain-containing protein [Curtobacterium sp. A7_M15]